MNINVHFILNIRFQKINQKNEENNKLQLIK